MSDKQTFRDFDTSSRDAILESMEFNRRFFELTDEEILLIRGRLFSQDAQLARDLCDELSLELDLREDDVVLRGE